jgi:hypothetical protein
MHRRYKVVLEIIIGTGFTPGHRDEPALRLP